MLFPIYDGVTDFPDDYIDWNLYENHISSQFIGSANWYIRWFREVKKFRLSEMETLINNHFSGDTRDYMLSLMFGNYANGEGVDKHEYVTKLRYYLEQFQNPDYIDYAKSALAFYEKSVSKIPDDVLKNTILEDTNNTESNLESLMNKFKGKNIVIDFWASWCAPCIQDIKDSNKVRAMLENNNVSYIFISIDSNNNNWVKSATNLKITENQYRIINSKDSPLPKYLMLNSIPRYVFIDKNSNIISAKGRAPLDGNVDYFRDIFDIKKP